MDDAEIALAYLHSLFIAINLDFVAGGLSLCLAGVTLISFLRLPSEVRKTKLPFLLLSLALCLIYVVHATIDTYIVKTVMSFGSVSLTEEEMKSKLEVASTTDSMIQIVTSVVSNSTMIYRCYILYSDRLWVLALPVLLELASIGTGIPAAFVTIRSTGLVALGERTITSLTATWFFLSVAVNVVVTSLIIFKLLIAQHRLAKNMENHTGRSKEKSRSGVWTKMTHGNSKVRGGYMGVVSILAESSLPLAAAGIAAGVTMASGYYWNYVFNTIWYAFCALCPQIMTFRIMRGWAWDRQNYGDASEPEMISQPLMFARGATTKDSENELGGES